MFLPPISSRRDAMGLFFVSIGVTFLPIPPLTCTRSCNSVCHYQYDGFSESREKHPWPPQDAPSRHVASTQIKMPAFESHSRPARRPLYGRIQCAGARRSVINHTACLISMRAELLPAAKQGMIINESILFIFCLYCCRMGFSVA